MRSPLLREITIMLLAALPLTLLVLLCQLGMPRLRADPVGAEMAALPGRSSEAPLLAQTSPSDVDRARSQNGAAPFYSGRIDPARPFRFSGSPSDFANARDCLALAALAEAGGSDPGQRAVIQVVLNRVRHPAFAQTVCGTVFEGSERRTGCQFTFTCDGALSRRYSDSAWIAAQLRAEQALRGGVFAAVGNATHYHTDWVYPSWSPKLVKLARVETHLFFRWPGWFGSDAAARVAYHGGEPDFASLAGRRERTEQGVAGVSPAAALPADTPKIETGAVAGRDLTGKANFLVLGKKGSAADALAAARALCNHPGTCRVYGWSDPAAVPAALPLTRPARAALHFSYSRGPDGAEIALYNCDGFPGIPREQCIPKAR
jgi:hypothetical protein